MSEKLIKIDKFKEAGLRIVLKLKPKLKMKEPEFRKAIVKKYNAIIRLPIFDTVLSILFRGSNSDRLIRAIDMFRDTVVIKVGQEI